MGLRNISSTAQPSHSQLQLNTLFLFVVLLVICEGFNFCVYNQKYFESLNDFLFGFRIRSRSNSFASEKEEKEKKKENV